MIASTQTNHPLAGIGKPTASDNSLIEQATTRLKSAGLRITQPRLAILAALSNRSEPSSIEQLHDDVGSGNCDLVTVYRCMAAFEQVGIVRRAFFHNGTAMYEMNVGRGAHYHVVCKSTNRVEALDPEVAADLNRAVRSIEEKLRARGYSEVTHIIEFFGLSPQSDRAGSSPSTGPR